MLELCLTRGAVATHTPADGTALRPLWNTLLVNQFHDILPGICIAAALMTAACMIWPRSRTHQRRTFKATGLPPRRIVIPC